MIYFPWENIGLLKKVSPACSACCNALLVLDLPNVTDVIPAHPADELFLSIALAGEAQVIVSGDKHLLDLKNFR